MRGTSGHRARIAWCAVAASATLAGGFIVAGATQSAIAVAESVVAIERTTVTSTSRPVTSPTATAPPTPAVDDTVTLRNPQPAAPETPSTVAEASMVETTRPAATTQPAASTTVELEAPGTAAAETSVAPAVTEQAAEAADVEATVPAPTNRSSCRTDLPGAVMTIAMPDISYTCDVHVGGQSVIDSGVATIVTAQEWGAALASHPGAPGTLWITGHRSTHGGAFAAVPDLTVGSIVTVSDESRTSSYVIVDRSYVEIRGGLAVDASDQATEAATLDAVLRPDRNGEIAARLLLQTCDGENFRWMIYADLIED